MPSSQALESMNWSTDVNIHAAMGVSETAAEALNSEFQRTSRGLMDAALMPNNLYLISSFFRSAGSARVGATKRNETLRKG